MEQYIPKNALVALIDDMLKTKEQTSHLNNEAFNSGRWKALKKVKDILNTLEVKEVDLEKETEKWWNEHLHLNPKNQLWMDAYQSITFAKHFFELGLKAQKGEEV